MEAKTALVRSDRTVKLYSITSVYLNFTIIINALKKLGIDAELSGRNDMQSVTRKYQAAPLNMRRIAAFIMAHYSSMQTCKSWAITLIRIRLS